MARILVQTDDRRTILDEHDVQVADINDELVASRLLDRLERAIAVAERRRPTRRIAAIVPASDYREVGA